MLWWPKPPRPDPLVPTPGSTIADLLPAMAARLGLTDAPDLGLPEGERWVVLLIDGLGRTLLDQHRDIAPFLGGTRDHAALTACVPSTTATSLTSLGTGRWPGRHGIVGYTFCLDDAVFHPLAWKPDLPVTRVQPITPLLERHGGAQVNLADFHGSGLTAASLGRGTYVPVQEDDPAGRIDAVVRATERHGLVYTYERRLDMVGHVRGTRSAEWGETLSMIDTWVEELRDALPDEVRLIVTADHGMVDVPGRNLIFLSDEPDLAHGVTHIAGEPRFTHVHTAEPDAVRACWQEWLADHAWVRTRDDAITEGWFGPDPDHAMLAERVGDVVVAMRTDWAILERPGSGLARLVGHHGSLTDKEMRIPFLVH